MSGSLEGFLAVFEREFKGVIDRIYPSSDLCGKMINYALGSQGKRVRPSLLFLTYRLFSKDEDYLKLVPASIAVEMVHTYSLIHDDLPCMDDDMLRRSRYTVHVLYGEAQAVLTGDAILTDSFSLILDPVRFGLADRMDSKLKVELSSQLSKGAGSSGMVRGQVFDIYATDMRLESEHLVKEIRVNKTAKLIQTAMNMGGLLAGVSDEKMDQISRIGILLGEVFQIQDDLLDDTIQTKTPGKDKKSFKLTALTNNTRTELVRYVSLSMDEIKNKIEGLVKSDEDDEFKKYITRLMSRTY